MAKINFEDSFEIYLFSSPNETEYSSKLGEFLSFLKFHKVNLPYKFSFVATKASLIPEISLNQNILIDFSPNSLTESKDLQFDEFLKAQSNRALEKLYHMISLPNELPPHSDAQMKKICSLIKCLLSEGQFIFLEAPEDDLDPETLDLFITALKEHIKGRQVNVLIYSKNLSLWAPQSHKMVQRTRNYDFIVTSIARNYIWGEERDVFYAPMKSESAPNLNTLRFTVPKEKSQKKTAA